MRHPTEVALKNANVLTYLMTTEILLKGLTREDVQVIIDSIDYARKIA